MINRLPEPTADNDRRYVALLQQYDEELRRGKLAGLTPDDGAAETSSAGDNLLDCLHLLERVWPRAGKSSDAIPPNEQIGRFRIERVLGHGGFGVVYLATDPELNRHVALKVPRLHALANPDLLERFRREARAAGGLDHPHIVPVFEAGEVDGACYIASAYCPGSNLAEWLKDQPGGVTPRTAAMITARLAEAVAYSHARGVLHRDIKPSNVMLVPFWTGDAGTMGSQIDELPFTPKLGDFGLAKVMRDAAVDAAPETATTTALGTPAYMSPEQTGQQRIDVGPATDVYALGVVLYELLTGRPPFQGPNVIDVLELVRHAEPVPVRQLRPDVPRDLETVCHKCLEKEASRRYETSRDLAADLWRVLKHEPVVARRPSALYRLAKFARRNRAPVLATILILAAMMSGTAIATWQAIRAERARLRADEKARLAKQVVDKFYTEFAEKWIWRESGLTDVQREFLESAVAFYEELAKEQSDDHDVQAELARALSRTAGIHDLLMNFDKAAEAQSRAIAIYSQMIARGDNTTDTEFALAYAYWGVGQEYSQQGEYEKARDAYLESIALAERLLAADSDNVYYLQLLAHARSTYSVVLNALGRHTDAERESRDAIGLHRKSLDIDPANRHAQWLLGIAEHDLAEALLKLERLPEAEAAFREALAWKQRVVEADSMNSGYLYQLSYSCQCLADLLINGGRLDEALLLLAESLQISEELTERFPSVPRYVRQYALQLQTVGRIDARSGREQDAKLAYRKSADLLEQLLRTNAVDSAANNFESSWIFNSLAWLLATCDDPEFRDCERAVMFATEAVTQAPNRSAYWNTLGVAQFRAANDLAAIEALERSIELNHGGQAYDFFFLAMSKWRQGDHDEARDWHVKAVEWMQAHAPGDPELQQFAAEAEKLMGPLSPIVETVQPPASSDVGVAK